MIPRKTVLVLGAGASREFGLPLGVELIDIVKGKLHFSREYGSNPVGKGDEHVFRALDELAKEHGKNRSDYLNTCDKLRSGIGFSLSIDNYLHSHASDSKLVSVGKIAIAKSILDAERKSTLWFEKESGRHRFSTTNVSSSWLYPFIKILIAGVPVEEITNLFSNLAVVCFNYDRCFEHALFESLKLAYALTDEQSARIMSTLAIVHPYGAVGSLPWQGGNGTVEFGDGNRRDLHRVAEGIFLFTEQREDPDFVAFIDRHMPWAERIMFLGFGYYKQNLDLISRTMQVNSDIIGSAYGLSDLDVRVILSDLRFRYPTTQKGAASANLKILKCSDMIRDYSRFLADI